MALKRVDLSTDVYFVCLNHAMCTESEEIVGLLVGEVDEENVVHVVAVIILRRSDKRKDRVEISPEQLSNASTKAEKLACILKRPVRVVGWYHSHPKITVFPSLVDVCTQENYQFMDNSFIGMIFSVFNSDPNKFGGRIQMICFQSHSVVTDCNTEKAHLDIPIQLVPSTSISNVCMNSVVQLPRSLCQEEQLAYQMASQDPLDYLTKLHNSSVYLRKMGQIGEVICGPLLKMLEERILNNEIKRKRLQERKKTLAAIIEKTKSEQAKKASEKFQKLQKELKIALKEPAIKKLILDSCSKGQDAKVEKMVESKDLLNANEDLKVKLSPENCEKANKPSPRQRKNLAKDQEVPYSKEQVEYIGADSEEAEFKDWQTTTLNEQEWQSSMQQITDNEMAQLENFKTISVSKETFQSVNKVSLAEIPKESLKTKKQHFTDEKQSKKQKVQEILDELEVIKSSDSKDNLTLGKDLKSKNVGIENQPAKQVLIMADIKLIQEQSAEQTIQYARVDSPDLSNEVLLSTQLSDSSEIFICGPLETSKNATDALDSPLSPKESDLKLINKSSSSFECKNISADTPVYSLAYAGNTGSAINNVTEQCTDINMSLSSSDSKIYIEPISPPDVQDTASMSLS